MHIQRPINAKNRSGLTIEERWQGPDQGIIAAWERGREIGENPGRDTEELAARARRGELPILPWKGGVERALKGKQKYGTKRYLAMWQGLRGDDLDVDLSNESELTCKATGVTVVFTSDASKYSGPAAEES